MANILIGITGSVAAYKTTILIRNLTKLNHTVKVILTKESMNYVPQTLIAALGIEVYSDISINYNDPTQAMAHINLAKFADLFIITPASANTIAKLAHGFADNLLTQTTLAYNKPLYISPAMNQAMWNNPATIRNIKILQELHHHVIPPDTGIQACGDNGMGRSPEPEQLTEFISNTLDNKMNKKKLLITLGATIEPIDPVRYISNYSSGKMGMALIDQALNHDFEVIAICGKTDKKIQPRHNLTIVSATSALDMLNKTQSYTSYADIFISCAAVADYRCTEIMEEKLKKQSNDEPLTLTLEKNPDIVKTIAEENNQLFCVGFAAETENVIENAMQKLKQKSLDLIIANDVSNNQVFGQNDTSITIINDEGVITETDSISKSEAANLIIKTIMEAL